MSAVPTYVPLRVHGHHSMLTGVDAPRALLERARQLELPAMALCDVDTLAGLVDFLRAARDVGSVRPIVGAEISDPSGLPGRLIALVTSAQGYANLCKLVSARALGGDPGVRGAKLDGPEHFRLVEGAVQFQSGLVYLVDHPRLLVELAGRVDARALFAAISPASIQRRSAHSAAQQRNACSAADLRAHGPAAPESTTRTSRRGRAAFAHECTTARAARAAIAAGRGARLETLDPRRRAPEEMLTHPKTPAPEPPFPALELIEAARTVGIATVAVPDVYCAYASGYEDHRLRVAIKHNALLADLPESFTAARPAHLLAPGEMRALYTDLPESAGPFTSLADGRGALARTLEIAERALEGTESALERTFGVTEGALERTCGISEGALERTLSISARCTFTPELGGILFPTIALEADETAYSKLCTFSFQGASARYKPLKPEVVRRLDYELSTIEKLGFSPYFLLVKQIADFARERGIPCVGRGSAADSLVAYCLRLTDADPLRYELTFERFLNPARRDRPDIDLDFCWRRRDEVLDHVYTLFGPERTAMIATIATCGARAAFREAALVEGLPPAEVNRWSRRLPLYFGPKKHDEANAEYQKPGLPGRRKDSKRPSATRACVADALRAAPPQPIEALDGTPRVAHPSPIEAFDDTPSSRIDVVESTTPSPAEALEAELGVTDDATRALVPRPTAPRSAYLDRRSTNLPAHHVETPSLRTHAQEQVHERHDERATHAHEHDSFPRELAHNPIACSFRDTPEAAGFPFDDPRYVRVLEAAARLIDAPRHYGLHPGGVVVSPGPITDSAPCQRAAKGCIVTQFDKNAVEAIGLVKMDLLGNRALTTLDDCLKSLRARGVHVDLEALPEDDAATARTLIEGRTLGCFQVESPGMRNLLQQIGAKTMDDVIQAVALIRPGPAGSGMKDAYVRRYRKLEEPKPPHPRLTDLLWSTHGVMLYQEDVMQVAARLAGMDLSEADLLRRALQKRRTHDLERLATRFVEGCVQQGVERADALSAWDLIANFASFGFCKAHAVTYGRIAYRAVWLKTHYPAEYMAAFLASDTGYYATRVYVEEARRLGVPILGPCVQKSDATFAVEFASGTSTTVPTGGRVESHTASDRARTGMPAHSTPVARVDTATDRDTRRVSGPTASTSRTRSTDAAGLRVGIGQVKGLSTATCRAILDARASGGPFVSLPEFLARTGARTDETERLVRCGAFRSLDRTIPELLWRLALLRAPERRVPRDLDLRLDPEILAACRATPRARSARGQASSDSLTPGAELPAANAPRAHNAHNAHHGGWGGHGMGLGASRLRPGESASLFPDKDAPTLALPRLPDFDPLVRGRTEFELLGLTIDAHPLQLFPCPADARLATRVFDEANAEIERPAMKATRATESSRSRPSNRADREPSKDTADERSPVRRYRVLRPVNPIPCGELARYRGARVTLRGWPAATRLVRTEDGRTMRFLTLEDESGLAEVVIFPDVYETDGERLAEFGGVCTTGLVEDQMGACTLHAEAIW